MFKKVLIAEDHEIANISVQRTLKELNVGITDYVYYCDDALNRIRKALQLEDPYDLLITDLYFEEDNQQQQLVNGTDLIRAAKELQPDLKTVVFSAESRIAIIDRLFKTSAIDGYVRKARRDAQTLHQALLTVAQGKRFTPSELRHATRQLNAYEFSTFDLTIISLLSSGVPQKNIPTYLRQHDIKPSGLSSVEKRLNLMKETFGFGKNEQLIAYCKDIGVI